MATIVAPAIGSLNASGSGSVTKETPVSWVINGITHRFTKDISANDALFTAFDISDADPAAGSSAYVITMDESAFAAALKALMDSAVGAAVGNNASVNGPFATIAAGSVLASAPASPKTLAALLTTEVRAEVQAALDTNGVLAFLESNTFSDLAISVDTSGGAADIAGKLNNANDLKIMFQQIPNRETVIDELVTTHDRLPVKVGDKISFVFDLAETITITENTNAAPADGGSGNATGAGEGPQAASPAAYPSQGAQAAATTYVGGVRRVEFLLTVA